MNKKTKMLFGMVLLVASCLLISSSVWGGQRYPTRPVTLLNPFGAGGANDIHCRFLASVAPEYLGQPLVVTMKSGAGGTIGTAFVKRAKPDGYTLLFGVTGPLSITCQIEDTGYTKDDFVPIVKVNHLPIIVAVAANKPWKTLEELIDHIRKNPKKMVFGTTAVRGITGLSHHRLLRTAEIKTIPPIVAYKGVSKQILSMLKGDTDYAVQIYLGLMPFIDSKEIRVLAVLDDERLPFLPDVPTAKELGYDLSTNMWMAIMAPKGTPKKVVETLSTAFSKMVKDRSFLAMMKKVGLSLYFEDGVTFQKHWDEEYKMFGKLIEDLGLRKK